MKTLFPLSLIHKNSSKSKKNIQESYSSLLMSVSVTKDLSLSFFISENRIRGLCGGPDMTYMKAMKVTMVRVCGTLLL